MTPEEQVLSELETGCKILKGPPVPSVLPAKGVGVFFEEGRMRWYTLSQFNNSDTTLRTPVTFKNALRFLWNLGKS